MLQGAVVGQIFGTAFIGWIAFGGLLYGNHANTSLPTSTQGCAATNLTDFSNSSQLFTTTALATSSRYKRVKVCIPFYRKRNQKADRERRFTEYHVLVFYSFCFCFCHEGLLFCWQS